MDNSLTSGTGALIFLLALAVGVIWTAVDHGSGGSDHGMLLGAVGTLLFGCGAYGIASTSLAE